MRTLWPALTAALLAGGAAWWVGERTYNHFQPSEEAASNPYIFAALNREMKVVNARNGAMTFGALGGLLGLALGLAGGLTRRSRAGAVLGGLVGLVLGATAGALPSFGIMPWHWEHHTDDPSSINLGIPLMIHAGLWTAIGAAAGLAYALGRGRVRPLPLLAAIFGGLVGAAFGTAIYEVVGAVAFPLSRTSDPFSETTATRLLARLCVAAFVALGLALALPEPPAVGKPTTGSTPPALE
jgi:hypothetical protein